MERVRIFVLAGVILAITSTTAEAQSHFTDCLSRTSESATVIIPSAVSADLAGERLSSGDEVAAFTAAGKCAGVIVWSGASTALSIWGKDAYQPSGYDSGNPVIFRIWDSSRSQEFTSVQASYASGSALRSQGIYEHGGIYQLSGLTVSQTSTNGQAIALAEGWNIISTYVNPANKSIQSIFGPVGPKLVLVKDEAGSVFMPEYSIDQIKEWDVTQGYRVYMNEPDTIVVTGTPIAPSSTPITLEPGWNLVSFLLDRPLTASQAFASLGSAVTLVKDNKGNVYLPEYQYDSIGMLAPGNGYMVYVKDVATLVYPDAPREASSKNADQDLAASEHGGPGVGFSANVVVKSSEFTEGSVVTAWAGDRQVGAASVEKGVALLVIVGDDPTTGDVNEGAAPGQSIEIKVGESAAQIVSLQDVLMGNAMGSLVYAHDAVYLAEAALEKPAMELPAEFLLDQNYPNPFNPSTTIRYGLAENTRVKLEVFNLLGQRVRTLVNEEQPAGRYELQFDATNLPSGMYLYRLQAGSFVQARTMQLVK